MLDNIAFMTNYVKKYCYPYLIITILFSLTSFLAPLIDTLFPKLIIDSMVNSNYDLNLLLILVLTFIIQLINSGAYSFFLTYYVPKAEYKIKVGIKDELYEKVSKLDLNYFENPENYNKYTLALKEAENRITDLMQTIGALLGSLFYLTTLSLIIFSLKPFLIIIAILSTIISFLFNKLISKLRYSYQMEINSFERKEQYVNRIFYEPQYSKDVRFFRLYKLFKPVFKENAFIMYKLIKKHTFKIACFDFFMNLLKGPLLQLIIMIYLIINVKNGASTIGDFTALLLATIQLGNQLYSISFQFNQINEHSLYIQNLRAVLNIESSIEGSQIEMKNIDGFNHEIQINNISFTYDSALPKILDGISFTVKKGEKIGIVGHNGAGKTTLIKLLTRLYDVTEGEILLDGVSYNELNVDDIRSKIGLVFQDLNFYPQTIAENVLLREVESIEDENKVFMALEKVGLFDKIKNLPKGIYTQLSKEFDKDGIMLSGGELQKLAIARTYLNDYKILILDEPSSALDPFAEHEISEALFESVADKAMIMISHKLSLTKNMDKIYVLDNGKICEEGTHEELLKRKGIYFRMFTLQSNNYLK